MNQSSCSAVVHSLQPPSTHSVTTHFQRTPRNSSYSRSLVDSSCPNHQIPCSETVERYRCKLCSPSVPLSLSLSPTYDVLLVLQQGYIQHHQICISLSECDVTGQNHITALSSNCPPFSIRLLIRSWKWRSSVFQWIAARSRRESLMTTVRHTRTNF